MKQRKPRKLITNTPNKSRLAVILTPKGINLLNQMAKQTGLSKSQLVEDFAKNSLGLPSPTEVLKESNQEALTKPKSVFTSQETLGYGVVKQQFEDLEEQLQCQHKLTSDLRSQIEALETSAKEKDALIEELQARILTLQSTATIGEWQLNKWRRS